MRKRLIPLCFALIISIQGIAAAAQDCPALVNNAMTRAQNACAGIGSNQACYGYHTLDARLTEGLSQFAFNGVGDITPVDTIESLRLSALNPETDDWGVALMRIHADIPNSKPNQNVTLVAFGEVSLNPDLSGQYQPMQAFTFSTGDGSSGCTNITENGLLIQTPEGIGKVTLWINQVKIRIGSTVLFQAAPGGDLKVSTFEGAAEVEAMGEMQVAATGMSVSVPMNDALQPAAPPTIPVTFDGEMTGLQSLVDMTTSYTDGSVTQLFVPENNAGSGQVSGNTDENGNGNAFGVGDHTGDCNGDNGQGNANGNCFGHSDPPGQGNGNANGNGQGNGNGNGQGNGQGSGNGNGQGNGNGNGNNQASGGQGGGVVGDLVSCILRLCILR